MSWAGEGGAGERKDEQGRHGPYPHVAWGGWVLTKKHSNKIIEACNMLRRN